MITDADLARLVSGEMTAAERADFAERVRAQRELLTTLIAACSGHEYGHTSEPCAICDTLRGVVKPCPAHSPDTRQRDGRCYACGAVVP